MATLGLAPMASPRRQVSTASLKRFGELCGLGAVAPERFRANLEALLLGLGAAGAAGGWGLLSFLPVGFDSLVVVELAISARGFLPVVVVD